METLGLNILSSVWATIFCFTRFFGHGMYKEEIYEHVIYIFSIFLLLFIYLFIIDFPYPFFLIL